MTGAPRAWALRASDGCAEYDGLMAAAREPRDCPLRLSLSGPFVDAPAPGRAAACAQAIATWAAGAAPRAAEAHVRLAPGHRLRSVAGDLPGMALALLSDHVVCRGEGHCGWRPAWRALREEAQRRLLAMAERRHADAGGASACELVFPDWPPNLGFHVSAYLRRPRAFELFDVQAHGFLVVSPREMHFWAANALQAALGADALRGTAPLLDDSALPLGHVIHEAFRNAVEHGYAACWRPLEAKGLRAILVGLRRFAPEAMSPGRFADARHPGLERWASGLRQGFGEGAPLLEASVLDTGPGFRDGAHLEGSLPDLATAKRGPNSGLGMGRILRRVGEFGGVLRIRSSTAELLAAASPDGGAGGTGAPSVIDGLPRAAGTVVTAILPAGAAAAQADGRAGGTA